MIFATDVPSAAVKRQRKLSVQKVSANPSGHTLTPRLAIIVSFKPSPAAGAIFTASEFGSRDGHPTYTSMPSTRASMLPWVAAVSARGDSGGASA